MTRLIPSFANLRRLILSSGTLLILGALVVSAAHPELIDQSHSDSRQFILNTGSAEVEGSGQVDASAWHHERFSRLGLYTAVSSLGLGEHVSTNLGPRLDIRLFENFFPVNHSFAQSHFNVALHIRFANAGAAADYYPFHRPFHISPGFLFYNRNRVNASLRAQPNAIFTINNIDWFSDNAHPVYGTGRLDLGGSGFMITAGYGRIASHTEKHWTFPFQAGVAFIHTPQASFSLAGEICDATGRNCQPAATYPGFANALRAQLVTWNRNVAPYHIFPVIEGGVAYTFDLQRRSFTRVRR